MHVLVGCEQFGKVRQAFRRRGHDAWSCDVQPTRDGSFYHLHGDVRHFLAGRPVATPMGWQVIPWDLAIFHPDCTFLTCSAEWAYADPDYDRYPCVGYHQKVKPGTLVGYARRVAREQAVDFVLTLANCDIPKIVIENPRGHLSSAWRKPDQTIQPNQFGDDASKATCLWLKNVPLLKPTKLIAPRIVDGKPRWANQTDAGQNRLSPGDDRAMQRAATYPGIAEAFADQLGGLVALQASMPFIARAVATHETIEALT
jgi:hypothetical protein